MNIPMKTVPPSEAHQALRNALTFAIIEHGKTIDAMDVLAVLSHLVGQVIAVQDQRKYTADMAMAVVIKNIERGNGEVVNHLLFQTGGNA